VSSPAPGDPWVVVGLGNPGPGYAGNRHNVGMMVLDELAARVGGRFRAGARGRVDVLEGRLAGGRVVLAKPRSYMNESGGPVTAVVGFYKVPVEQLLVVHDELDIPFDALRIKVGGGHGGHNGLRSIDASTGAKGYARVRVGIGRPPGRMDPADFVLRDFPPAERKELPFVLDRAADAVEAVISSGVEAAQNAFHAG